MQFGLFDHLDDNGAPTQELYEDRLKLVALIEREGFHVYHLAEHHATPLGSAPSPGVFLAAVAQRTRRLKFGPLVYLLQLYHPLRIYEEICMLDQMSGGRYQVGVGRGGAVGEHARFGLTPDAGQAMYEECLAVLLKAFQSDVLNHEGRYFQVRDFITVMKPVQRPRPALWYGSTGTDSAAWAAREGVNVVTLGAASRAKDIVNVYRENWLKAGKAEIAMLHVGTYRHIVVAETDAEAQATARVRYAEWRDTIGFLARRDGVPFGINFIFPETWEELEALGNGFAGAPATVRARIADLQRETKINYLVCQMAFGRMRLAEAAHSIELFAREVMPAFA